jgi:hypothetical protein
VTLRKQPRPGAGSNRTLKPPPTPLFEKPETFTPILRWCTTWSLRARIGGTPNELVVWRTTGFSGIRSPPQFCGAVAPLPAFFGTVPLSATRDGSTGLRSAQSGGERRTRGRGPVPCPEARRRRPKIDRLGGRDVSLRLRDGRGARHATIRRTNRWMPGTRPAFCRGLAVSAVERTCRLKSVLGRSALPNATRFGPNHRLRGQSRPRATGTSISEARNRVASGGWWSRTRTSPPLN